MSCPATDCVRETKDDDDGREEETAPARLKEETASRWDRSRPRLRTPPPDAARVRLADAYLLRMSPPPPSHQADDGRRRAAYSDPVRWVSPVSDGRRVQPDTPRPNGLRAPASGGVGRTACTNEALDEAIRRRNRKCKPSAMRRLQAAKAVGGGDGPETTDAAFEPLFEGVTCSLRARSASLGDCNALAKSRDHVINF